MFHEYKIFVCVISCDCLEENEYFAYDTFLQTVCSQLVHAGKHPVPDHSASTETITDKIDFLTSFL
jgi:hypothetical protein